MLGLNRSEVLKEFLPLDIFPTQFRPSGGNIPYGSTFMNWLETLLTKVQLESYDDFGAICKKPEELTALSLFLRETNAELCGNNINKPYKHLNRYGYFSGSRS